MVLWSILAVMTALAVLLLLRPLLASGAIVVSGADDRAFYAAQIADIDRDKSRGLIGETEAEAARTEAARRLLRSVGSANATARPAANLARYAAYAVMLGVPLLALPFYARNGSPHMPNLPRAERVAQAEAAIGAPSREGMLRVFALLEKDPRNPILLDFLVPHLLRAERYEAAANALTIVTEELGPTAKRLTDLAAARGAFARQSGEADPEVRKLLERALQIDPNYMIARFNLGLVKAEDGDKDGALADLRAMEAALPKEAPIRQTLAKVIKQIEEQPAAAPPPGGEAIAALPAPDRDKAIRGMVEGLDQRLAAQGGSLEEWRRLLRAYTVLKEADKAKATLVRARAAFADKKDDLAKLASFAKELGLGD